MLTLQRRIAKWSVRALALAVGVIATIVLGYAIQTRMTLPDLSAWHRH